MPRRKTKEELQKELNDSNRNITVLGEYINNKTHIEFRCDVCGNIWKARPDNICHGYGCPKCGIESARKARTKPTNLFISQANLIHNYFYNYDKVDYINDHTPVTITCPIHGDFIQTPANHLNKHGCPGCANNKKLSVESFIEKAKKLHRDLYDYSKIKKINGNKEKVEIVCPKHGSFFQRPDNHLNGAGCPICKSSKGELLVKNILDDHNISYLRQYYLKINNKQVRIDFRVLLDNIEYFIEYNGRQHYVPVDRFGGEIQFQSQTERDDLVKNYCKENKIIFIELPYTDSKEDIINKLSILW